MSQLPPDDLSIDGEVFRVIRNAEEQCSLWPAGQPVPAGWENVFGPGPREECLQWIDAHWRDLRPRSLRERMQPDEQA